jgi:hypothetical protein
MILRAFELLGRSFVTEHQYDGYLASRHGTPIMARYKEMTAPR